MSIFAQAERAIKPRTHHSGQMALLYAALIVLMVVAQLFTFDGFLTVLASFELPFGTSATYTIGAVLVAAEVFSLPFLLRMTLSRPFRWFSMICSWFVAGIWLFLTSWLLFMNIPVETVGFLGTVSLIPGPWTVLLSIAFAIIAAWTSWGLWPGRRYGKVRTSAKKKASSK